MPGEDPVPPDGGQRQPTGRTPLALSGAGAVIAAVMVAIVVIVVLSGSPVTAILRVAMPALVALALVVAAVGAGDLTVGVFRALLNREGVDRQEGMATRLIVGHPILGAVSFLVALISTDPLVLLFPAVVLFVLGLRTLWRTRLFTEPTSFGPGTAILAALLLTALLMALVPAVSLDEVSYHLAIPSLWIAAGEAVALPLMSHSWFPLGTESADLVPLALLGKRGAIASHLLHLFVAMAGALVVLRQLPRSPLRTLGVAAMLSTPAIILGAGWSGTDVPLIAITCVLYVSLDRFVRSSGGSEWIAAAIAAGLLVKYTFLPIAGLLVGGAFLFAGPHRRKLLVASLCGTMAGSIFYVRNLILTGNPVEPFLSATGGEIARFRWSGSWAETLSSYMFDPRMIDDSLGFVLPGLALAALALARMMEPWRRTVAFLMLAMALVLTLVGPSGRILLPFLFVPAWIALSALLRAPRRTGAITMAVVLTIATFIQMGVTWLHIDRLDPLRVVTGDVPDEEWVGSHRRSMHLIREGSAMLSRERTLVLGVNELFWFEGGVTGGANFDSPLISDYLSLPSNELVERWRTDGIEQILVYPRLIRVGPAIGSTSDRQRALILSSEAAANLTGALRDHATVAGQTENAVLYRLD